ncbi:MAG: alpha/beta fold hydrolase [Streptosporangiaceae bacterium]
MLVHGFGLDMRMWDPQFDSLSNRFRMIRYDCRGFGASGEFDPGVPYTQADGRLSGPALAGRGPASGDRAAAHRFAR